MAKETLTAKQEKFCIRYCFHLNATKAAKEAGYSKNTAAIIGHENLRKPNIAERIRELQSNVQQLTEVTTFSQVQDWQEVLIDEEASERAKIEARKEISKLLGLYATEKRDLNIKTEQPLFGDGDE